MRKFLLLLSVLSLTACAQAPIKEVIEVEKKVMPLPRKELIDQCPPLPTLPPLLPNGEEDEVEVSVFFKQTDAVLRQCHMTLKHLLQWMYQTHDDIEAQNKK